MASDNVPPVVYPEPSLSIAIKNINGFLSVLTSGQRVLVIRNLAYCIHCGDKLRGPCYCLRDE
jgi:hypothetical protein